MEWEHEHGDQCIGCTYICQSHYFLPIPDLCPACECKAYWDVVWRDVVKFMWRGSDDEE